MNYAEIKIIEKKSELMKALRGYQRWTKEEKPPYAYKSPHATMEPQYYYDPYHNSITQKEDGSYDFYIQIEDGPEGDTWWGGNFKLLSSGVDIQITSERTVFTG